jgi:hypothetical protein
MDPTIAVALNGDHAELATKRSGTYQ